MTENLPAKIVDSGTAVAMAEHHMRRYDRWENAVNKFGGANDPMTVTKFGDGVLLNRAHLDAIYEFDWITGKIVDIPAADATRKWIALTHEDNPERAEDAKKEIDRWNLRGLVEEAEKLARLYGGSLLVVGAFDGKEVSEPLDVAKIREVQFMHVVDRWMAYPLTFDHDPESPNFGDIETYNIHRVQITGVNTTIVHASRVIRFDGRYVPPLRRLRNFGWQNSVIIRLFDVIRQFGVSSQSGAATLQDQVIKKLKISNLQDLVTSGQWDVVSSRLALMAGEMAINNIAVYGDDEDIEKIGTPINQLPKLMDLFIDYVSAASDIPRARMFQNTTGNLGGDPGKSDLRVHYDNIEAMQENKLRRPVQTAINMLLSPLGYEEDEIGFTWNPLWQMSDTEQADIELKAAQRDQIYISAGVVEPEEVALSRFSGEEPDYRQFSIDTERRDKALEDLKQVDLISSEPTFEEQLALETNAQLQLQGGGNQEEEEEEDDRRDAANLTTKDKEGTHAHTFDIDFETGNGQTVDTLDDHKPHVHMIRSYRLMEGGEDGHTHMMGAFGRIPKDLSTRE